jgi:hypothetical protein
MMVLRLITACTTADKVKPRIKAHRISHAIDPLRVRAWRRASNHLMVKP